MAYRKPFDIAPAHFWRESRAWGLSDVDSPALVEAHIPRLYKGAWDGINFLAGTGEGVLVEPEVTNLLPHNRNIYKGNWIKVDVGTSYVEAEADLPNNPDLVTMNGSFPANP